MFWFTIMFYITTNICFVRALLILLSCLAYTSVIFFNFLKTYLFHFIMHTCSDIFCFCFVRSLVLILLNLCKSYYFYLIRLHTNIFTVSIFYYVQLCDIQWRDNKSENNEYGSFLIFSFFISREGKEIELAQRLAQLLKYCNNSNHLKLKGIILLKHAM